MALVLDTIYLDRKAGFEAIRTFITRMHAQQEPGAQMPQGVRLVAGPWCSSEDLKVIVVLEIEDLTKTFRSFYTHATTGVVVRRTIEPIVSSAEALRQLEQDG
jgi:hypothetical protein